MSTALSTISRWIVGVVPDIWYEGDSADGVSEVLLVPVFPSGMGQPLNIVVAMRHD